MKRFFLSLGLLLFFAMGAACPTAALTETDSGILYRLEDGAVTIEGWAAVGTVMTVPETIEGFPVRAVAAQACRGESALTEVVLPASLVEIGAYAFAECPNLARVTLAGGETVGFAAFRDCRALLAVELPDTLRMLEDEAFRGCTMLAKMRIPAAVTQIGYDVFNGCERLILNVEENKLAADYAERYAIPTRFTETWTFTLLMIGATVIVLSLGFLLICKIRARR